LLFRRRCQLFEVACGLGVSFARVKHHCNLARRQFEKREKEFIESVKSPGKSTKPSGQHLRHASAATVAPQGAA
jgi:hypothetical protein